jgi:hypothetical protein
MLSDGAWWRPWVRDGVIALVVVLVCLPPGLVGVALYLKGWDLMLVGPPLLAIAMLMSYRAQQAVCRRYDW